MIYLTVLFLGLVLAGLIGVAWRRLSSAERWFGVLVVGFTCFVLFGKIGGWSPALATWAYLGPSVILVGAGLTSLVRARGVSGIRLAVLLVGILLASLPALMIGLFTVAMFHH